MLQKYFGESTLSRTQVFEWHKAFGEGREDVENLPHASRPSTSVNDDNIEKVKKIVLENRHVGIRDVSEAFNISYGSTQHIVVHVLGMKCVAARLVPKDLNFLQNERQVEVAKEMLANVADDPTFIKRIITDDETWVLIVFFDYRGVVHHEFVPEGQTVNKEYYLAVLRHLREAIHRKRTDLWADNSWIFYHDNAPSHSSLISTVFLAKHETKVLLSHRIRQIWLPVTFSCFQNSNIRSGERAMSRLRP